MQCNAVQCTTNKVMKHMNNVQKCNVVHISLHFKPYNSALVDGQCKGIYKTQCKTLTNIHKKMQCTAAYNSALNDGQCKGGLNVRARAASTPAAAALVPHPGKPLLHYGCADLTLLLLILTISRS